LRRCKRPEFLAPKVQHLQWALKAQFSKFEKTRLLETRILAIITDIAGSL